MLPPFFKQFSERERVLLLLVCWVFVAFWGLWLSKRTAAFAKQWEVAKDELSFQKEMLGQAFFLETQLKRHLDTIDVNKTLDPSHLIGRVDKLAREASLTYELSTPKTVSGDLFELHNVTLTIRQASLEKLLTFEGFIESAFPYISLSSARFTAVPSNPALLDTSFVLTAFELRSQP